MAGRKSDKIKIQDGYGAINLEHPEEYTEASYKNLSAGRVCGIVGICVALAVVAFVILVILGVTALGVGSALMLG